MSTFDRGDRIRLSASFTDIAGAASDPTEVTVKHRGPSGTVVSEVYNGGAGSVQRDGPGEYYLDVDVDAAGRWYWRVEGVDTPRAAGERAFDVRGSQFP